LLSETCQRTSTLKKTHSWWSGGIDDDIVAAMQDPDNQSPIRLNRSLKINTKELMKFLEEDVKPCMVGHAAGCHFISQHNVHPFTKALAI
jgi:hypothetical protein